ncbi:MAG: molybdenum cofactor guanylyltransferase, partial [Clostridia bacterium]|nr:molybdenum cofactor guanylyltransferase [Clostridia bacterium]
MSAQGLPGAPREEGPEASLILLAGGASRRMGRDKALLPFGGEPLITRIARRLAPVAAEVVVVANRPEPYLRLGFRVVPDPPGLEGEGPLAGLLAGMRAATRESCLLVACDMPFASPCLARLLLAPLQEGWEAALPAPGGREHPLFAAYRRALAPDVAAALAAGVRRPLDFLAGRRLRRLEEAEIAACGSPGLLLANVNRPEEYRQALEEAGET